MENNTKISLSPESHQQIEALFRRLDSLLAPFCLWKSEQVETAISQILKGEISLHNVHGKRNKIVCKLMCELIEYIQSLELKINDAKKNVKEKTLQPTINQAKIKHSQWHTSQKQKNLTRQNPPNALTPIKPIRSLITPSTNKHNSINSPPANS